MRTGLVCLAVLFTLARAPLALAAPVDRPADVALWLEAPQFAPGMTFPLLSSTGATVTVDELGGTLSLPAGALTLMTPISLPVTVVPAGAVTATKLSNFAGTFSIGGASGAETPCPGGPGSIGAACVQGGGLGGVMNLTGTVNLKVLPGLITLPVVLNPTQLPSTSDTGPWTRRAAYVGFAPGLGTSGSLASIKDPPAKPGEFGR